MCACFFLVCPNGHVRTLLLVWHVVIKTDAAFGVDQVQRLGTGHPVRLRRSDTTRPSRLQLLVDLADVIRNFSALLKVKSLHIGDRLVDSADRRRVADSSLRAISRPKVAAVDAADTNLSHDQLLSTLRVASRDILVRRRKDLYHLGSHIALAIRKRVAVAW